MSLPVLGAWIEISLIACHDLGFESLPVLGAWIEINWHKQRIKVARSRSLYWERGLKSHFGNVIYKFIMSLPVLGAWIEISPDSTVWSVVCVAPCIGSVD